MIELKKILSEILNTYKVEADLWTDPEFNVTDILNQILHTQQHALIHYNNIHH